jgi:hypothetical protein
MQTDSSTLDLIAKLAQIVVAVVVGYIAWLARRDAKRNSVAGLLKIVGDQRKEYVDKYAGHLTEVLSQNSGFASKPTQYKKIILDQLEQLYSAKRGLDLAYQKLLSEADTAWNLGQSLQRQMEGMNPDQDAQFNKLFSDLRAKHLSSYEQT